MLLKPNELDIVKAHQADLQRAAAQHAHTDDDTHHPFYAPALAKVGDLMVALGSDLQARYGELIDEAHQPPSLPHAGQTIG